MPITVDATNPKIQEAMQYGAKDLVKDLWDLTKEKVTKKVDLTKAPEQTFEEFWSSLSDEKKTKITELALAPGAGMLKVHGVGKLGIGMLKRIATEATIDKAIRSNVAYIAQTPALFKHEPTLKKATGTLSELWKYPQSFYSRLTDVERKSSFGKTHAGWVTGYPHATYGRPVKSLGVKLGFDINKMRLGGNIAPVPTVRHEMTHVLQHAPFTHTPREAMDMAWNVRKRLAHLKTQGYTINMHKYSPTELHAILMEGVEAKPGSKLYKDLFNSSLRKALRMSHDNLSETTLRSLQRGDLNQADYEMFLNIVSDIDYHLGTMKP